MAYACIHPTKLFVQLHHTIYLINPSLCIVTTWNRFHAVLLEIKAFGICIWSSRQIDLNSKYFMNGIANPPTGQLGILHAAHDSALRREK